MDKNISHKEFMDFLKSQPGDKEVNMSQNIFRSENDGCGCLMVQYGRSQGMKEVECSYDHIQCINVRGEDIVQYKIIRLEIKTALFIQRCDVRKIKTFQEAIDLENEMYGGK